MKLAMLLSCTCFEGFFGRVQRQTRESYLASYRHDWAWYYAQGLTENGVSPTLYIPALFEAGRYETDAGVAVRFLPIEAWYRPFEQAWLKRLLRQNRWSLYADERLNTIAFMASLRAALAEDQADVLYVQEHWSGRFDHLAHALELPVVSADHGGLPDRVVKAFKRSAFDRAALCYSQTDDERRVIESYGGRAMLAPNGCDVSLFCPDPSIVREKSVLTVTRLTNRQKRTSDLIRAMARLPDDWRLDVIGSGPDRAMLEGLAASLGLAARVRFHGLVSRTEVRDHLRRCGVYAMPSSNEAVALAALEAMACGSAVVLSRIRAFEQLVTDGLNGRLTPVGDVAALAGAISEAWERREALGQAAARTVAARYNARTLYARLAESLRRVCEPPEHLPDQLRCA
jgi:glycosyltransferase involved in cell wall biosynthesis